MATINQLSTMTTLQTSDKLVVYSNENGDARKASLASLVSFLDANWTSPNYVTQYASPNINGFVVTIQQTSSPIWLLLQPIAPYALGSIVLPLASTCFDGQEVLIYSSQAVTSLIIQTNGALQVNGAPTSLVGGTAFTLRFNVLYQTWYTVANAANPAQFPISGTFTPIMACGSIVGPLPTLSGRYQRIGNQVTMNLGMVLSATTTIVFTTATDYIELLPAELKPSGTFVSGSAATGSVSFQIGGTVAPLPSVFQFRFSSSSGPTITFPPGFNVNYQVSYLIF